MKHSGISLLLLAILALVSCKKNNDISAGASSNKLILNGSGFSNEVFEVSSTGNSSNPYTATAIKQNNDTTINIISQGLRQDHSDELLIYTIRVKGTGSGDYSIVADDPASGQAFVSIIGYNASGSTPKYQIAGTSGTLHLTFNDVGKLVSGTVDGNFLYYAFGSSSTITPAATGTFSATRVQ